MRRQVRSVTFVIVFSALAASAYAGQEPAPEDEPAAAPVAVQRVDLSIPGVRDEAAMLLVGSALIAIAAAVRRAA